jgi:hypothetical protein
MPVCEESKLSSPHSHKGLGTGNKEGKEVNPADKFSYMNRLLNNARDINGVSKRQFNILQH